jgi:hypothetical protein
MAKTNTTKGARKRVLTNKQKLDVDQTYEQLNTLQNKAAGDKAVAELMKTQEKLEKRLGGKAYFIKPDQPLPPELLAQAKRELEVLTVVGRPSPTFDEAFQQVVQVFHDFMPQRQNHLLARLLEELRENRLAEFHSLTDKIGRSTERHHQLADAAKELDQVLTGNFTIVHV